MINMEYSDIKKGRINGDMYWQKYISIDTVLVMVNFFLNFHAVPQTIL